MRSFIAIDPGNKKCGLLLADLEADLVLDGRVIDSNAVIDCILEWRAQGPIDGIVLGNGTTSKYWEVRLKGLAPIEIVEERGTTLRARERYWELWPPGIWLRWLPRGLLLPTNPLDAVAALVLLEDHLSKKLNWTGPPNFKISLER
ncbi:resolvase [Prochlorococcus sp. MIT 1307]|uniref:resolvase n=1 Tax=Prochlorococcus sp. MIT 1307 TaxID=3096219 RepID=UPI002A751883|nr:resolvase [Prochlorococcus sp. MIT 1307]